MKCYDRIVDHIENPGALTKLSATEARELTLKGYPEDYVMFLCEVGYGNLDVLQIYSRPIEPQAVYPVTDLERVKLFGDDFQGYCYGFDETHEMKIVEMDPKGGIRRLNDRTFKDFLVAWLSPLE
jgi:hypothetical protein